ncbi:MAG: ATP-binding cassette domain-containing protein [Nocardioidaceae bacterium]
MSTSVVVDRVSKRFKLTQQKTIKQVAVDLVRGRPSSTNFTALDDVSFTLEQGESIALMGLNGSGKSTLLKLISGVMAPDAGQVLTRGRIAGLIEVGAGLHPDL